MDLKDKYCSYGKSDISQVKDILNSELTIDKVLYACLYDKQMKNLPVVRLNSDICLGYLQQNIKTPDIETAVEYICARDNSLLIKCIEKLSDSPVVLEISGGFSTLLATLGSEYIFRQLRKQETTILSAISRINLYTVGLVKIAASYGVKVISFADPSALDSVLGEKRLVKLSAEPSLELVRGMSGFKNVLMHICPRTSFTLLKHCGCVFSSHFCTRNTVLEELVSIDTQESFVLTGHVCINADINDNNLCIMTYPLLKV